MNADERQVMPIFFSFACKKNQIRFFFIFLPENI